jgi:hypothetical protein
MDGCRYLMEANDHFNVHSKPEFVTTQEGEKMERKDNRRYRSIFWPILLIGIGIIWLLANLEIIPGVNWRILWRFWPFILIAIGLDVIFARRSPILGALLGFATVALAILIMVFAPSLGLVTSTEISTDRFTEPVGLTKSAQVDIELSVGPIAIDALSDSTQLLDAEITHVGKILFESQGEEEKKVTLQQEKDLTFNRFEWPEEDLDWDIGLNPEVPIFLELKGGVGDAELDLSELQITGIDVDLDVGGLNLTLPTMDDMYTVKVNGGVGEVRITILEGANLRLDLEGDVGDFVVNVPEDAAVSLDANTDVGNIKVPSSFIKRSGEEDHFIGESGIWETSGYRSADRRISIDFNGGVGDLIIR